MKIQFRSMLFALVLPLAACGGNEDTNTVSMAPQDFLPKPIEFKKLCGAIDVALSEIPVNCRLAEAVRDMLVWSCGTWEECWDKIMAKYGHYHPVHTINNAAKSFSEDL